jgi:hypothetical protein
MSGARDPRFPTHWRTDRREITRELEAAGWRVFRYNVKSSKGWYDAQREGFDLFLGAHRFTAITPGARHALDEVVMGRPAPRRELTVEEAAP